MSSRAVVLAAGMGTRMKSARPKVLHEICGRPMLWWTLRALAEAGVDEVVVVVNRTVEAALDGFTAPVRSMRTVVQEPQRGTGHAVQVALDALEPGTGALVVAYGDMPLVDASIFRDVQAAVGGDAALALVTARMPLPSNFGRVLRRGEAVEKIVEARDCTPEQLAVDEMNAGIYAFDERALRGVIGRLSDDNAQKELYLTDTVALVIGEGRRVVPVVCADHRAVLGVNDRVELAAARAVLNARLCEAHMREGVTIVDPATTYLEPDLSIARDVTIFPNTWLCGATALGEATRVGPNARIEASRVGARCEVHDSVVRESAIGDDTHVGPYAHLRRGTVLGGRVHVGNFVEVKASTLHDGVKSGHLTYLGDAEIGAETNIGAGTITCNYDGVRKNRTEIGAGAFIGSNSSLVAPVRIGDGALTGAGAVVIRDVPAGGRVVGNPAKPLPAKAPAET